MEAHGSALVTGANRGIGRAVALELGRRGFAVVAAVRDPATAESLLADAAAVGIRCVLQRLDLRDVPLLDLPDDLRVVVNNAGMQAGYLPVEAMPLDVVRVMLETNVVGQIAVLQQVIPPMRARREGVIVNITSAGMLLASPFYGAYRASKAAMSALCETLVVELAPFGIRVVEILPGPVATDGLAGSDYIAAVEHAPYHDTAARMIGSRDRIHAVAVSPEAAARRIVDVALDDAAPLRSSCDPMGDELLARWRELPDQDLLDDAIARYVIEP